MKSFPIVTNCANAQGTLAPPAVFIASSEGARRSRPARRPVAAGGGSVFATTGSSPQGSDWRSTHTRHLRSSGGLLHGMSRILARQPLDRRAALAMTAVGAHGSAVATARNSQAPHRRPRPEERRRRRRVSKDAPAETSAQSGTPFETPASPAPQDEGGEMAHLGRENRPENLAQTLEKAHLRPGNSGGARRLSRRSAGGA